MLILNDMIKWLKKLFSKFFKRQNAVDLSIIDYNFLKNAAKLSKKGRVVIFKGGIKALSNALYDRDNAVYILIIKKDKTMKSYSLKQWFKSF